MIADRIPDPQRSALLVLWEQLYQVQVLVCAMDPALINEIEVQVGLLQYRTRMARQCIKPIGPRGRPRKQIPLVAAAS